MGTSLTPAQRKQSEVRTQLRTMLDKAAEKYVEVLPKHISPSRMVQIAINAATNQPKLFDCTPGSFALAVMAASQCGIEPDGYHGHLIPYGKTCQFVPDYKGLIQLALRNGVVIDAQVVYENDHFEYTLGTDPKIVHIPNIDGDRGDKRCAYAVAKFKDGTVKFIVATKQEIEKRRAASSSSSKSDSPWKKWEDEMWQKGLDVDTPIPTPDGWSPIGELVVGDVVFDMEGQRVEVTDVSPVKMLPCFRVTFTDGEEIICDDEHRWVAKCGGANLRRKPFGVLTINEMYEAKQDGLAVTVPICKPLDMDDIDLPVDPYMLGYWLGDGSTGKASITCHKGDKEFLCDQIASAGYQVGVVRDCDGSNAACVGVTDGMFRALRLAGVLDCKSIPTAYMRASARQRRALLQGLMDSDGHICKSRGQAYFVNTNFELAQAVAELVSSLGDVPCSSVRRNSGFGVDCVSYCVRWRPSFCCVRMPRKRDRYKERRIEQYRSIRSIERISPVPTRCIAVDSPTRTYLAGKSMAVTHNTAVKMLMKYVPRSQTTDHMPDPITMALRADDAHERGVTVDPLALASGGASRARPLTSRADHIFEAIDHSESPSEQFAKAIEMVDTEEGVKSLYSTMIDANREQIDQQELEEAVEARELRLAVIRGEVE